VRYAVAAALGTGHIRVEGRATRSRIRPLTTITFLVEIDDAVATNFVGLAVCTAPIAIEVVSVIAKLACADDAVTALSRYADAEGTKTATSEDLAGVSVALAIARRLVIGADA
jgi:hypothetical protein